MWGCNWEILNFVSLLMYLVENKWLSFFDFSTVTGLLENNFLKLQVFQTLVFKLWKMKYPKCLLNTIFKWKIYVAKDMMVRTTCGENFMLTLNAAAKMVHDVWQFFLTLSLIVNFVDFFFYKMAFNVKIYQKIKNWRFDSLMVHLRQVKQLINFYFATSRGYLLGFTSSLYFMFNSIISRTLDDLIANGPNKNTRNKEYR